MAILHIVSTHLTAQALAKLEQRSHLDDGFVLMDDGVYNILVLGANTLSGRDVYLIHQHALHRGLDGVAFNAEQIDMAQLVALTVRYSSSMSW
ncbi:MAG TPA: hypothetical protein DE045_09010 [Oceanospirillaceae bacterium]|nr:hypothetical protein [Oceanospirillaceae bacterium]